MAHRSQCSSVGDNPLDPNYLPPHYREEYRLAIDALVDNDLQGYYEFLQNSEVVEFLARPEIEHIKSTIQSPNQTSSVPELTYHEGGVTEDGSSDTYWPVHSDLAAPGLDLGWPMQQHSFIGPTEVTTLVNPSDPDMPSIKEQARRLIKSAKHVIAVVMDMFTDVDIFSDLLDAAARHVPVYILLDEQNSHHFVAMVTSCRVNLDLVHMMRVRTVTGITYFCRTGKSFKGQVQDRFLLADCRAVLSGNYSFMWSYEKIHRCIAHLFLGELVTTFDEEFRILFAQSQPLIVDKALVVSSDTGSTGNLFSNQFGLKRTQSMRNTRSFLRQPELPSAFPYGDSDRNSAFPFRRNDPFRHTMEPGAGIVIGKYAQQQFRLQQSFLEQGRSIVSRQMEMSSTAFKRHSYAEGTQENYSSSRQFMKQRVMNNLEETDFQREQTQFYHEGPGPGSGHGHYDRLRGRVPHLAIDQCSDSSFPSETEPPPASYGHGYLSSDDLKHNPGHHGPPAAGRYGGGSGNKRPTMGQSYACQSSPTHLHPPEKHQFPKPSDHERDQDSSARQGLRSWRISSYLNTCEDGGEEGLPQPMGSDAFEEPQPESSGPHFGATEPPNVSSSKPRPDILRPRFGKPVIPENPGKDSGLTTTTTTTRDLVSDYRTSLLQKDREREAEKERERGGTREMGVDVEVKEAPENTLIKHESFRTRMNPLIQRSSRLRSSLIFSSSKLETHNSGLGLTPATEEDDQLDTARTSSIVAQILEKRRSITREPFEWRKKTEEKGKEEEMEKEEKMQVKESSQSKELTEQTPKVTTDLPKPQPLSSSLNMNDPASRLQYFKDLAAKRKASKMGIESSLTSTEPAEKKSDIIDKPSSDTSAPTVQSVSVNPPAPKPEIKTVDLSSKAAELTPKPSVTVTKPPAMPTKPSISHLKITEPATTTQKEENVSDSQKKDPFKSLKSLPSPKPFKRDGLKLKSLNPRRVSTGEEILTTDATDAEKSEQKKNRSHSSSSMTRAESKDGLHKNMGSTTSINTLGGEGKSSEGKPLDFLKKQTQRLKGFLGPKDKDKKPASIGDEKSMNTVMGITETAAKPASSSTKDATAVTSDQSAANHKASTSAAGSLGPSRYQTSSGSVLFSSNLRDDTKVILEQISANSQKNRLDREDGGGDKDSDKEKSLERHNSLRKNRFIRPQGNTQEREGLLKRIESMRKEKKVYSRFEMGNSLG